MTKVRSWFLTWFGWSDDNIKLMKFNCKMGVKKNIEVSEVNSKSFQYHLKCADVNNQELFYHGAFCFRIR